MKKQINSIMQSKNTYFLLDQLYFMLYIVGLLEAPYSLNKHSWN